MLTEEIRKEIRAKNEGKRMVEVESPDAEASLVFRAPTRLEFDRYSDAMAGEPEKRSVHSREFALACLVYPDQAGFMAVIDRFPGLMGTKNGVIDSITNLAGATTVGAVSKKF